MDLKNDFAFTPQPPLSPFTKVPQAAPLPSAGIWSPQPHPAPIQQSLNPVPVTPASLPPGAVTAKQFPVASAPPTGVQPPSPATGAAGAAGAAGANAIQTVTDLGPLKNLAGEWSGTGFNVIWRPNNTSGSDHFLEINLTNETLEFIEIPGDIPNRGLFQGDISMRGLRYLQQIQDRITKQGLHIEPGLWALVPSTNNPLEPQTVVRMASIPHGTSLLAQGTVSNSSGGPAIPPVSISPFLIALPNQQLPFPETNLEVISSFRSPPTQTTGVTQAMLNNPNSILIGALANQIIKQTTQLNVSSGPTPVIGGGIANTAFLIGGASGPNAQASLVTASFWIELVAGANGKPEFLQLQYSQTVMLNFAGLSWPHVSVATLQKV
jgi:hypothetical protein